MSTGMWFEEDPMRVIQKVGKRRAVVIPRDLCDEVGLQEGDFIELQAVDGIVIIRPKKLVDARQHLPAHRATLHST
jgi:AbrB family looped-hinge helix DNA binding protein